MTTLYSTPRYHNPPSSSTLFKSPRPDPDVKGLWLRLPRAPPPTPTSDSPSNSAPDMLAHQYLHSQLPPRLRALRPYSRMGYPFTQRQISGRRRVESANKTVLKLSFRPTVPYGFDIGDRNNDVDVVFGAEGGAIGLYRVREFQLDRELYERSENFSPVPLCKAIPGPGDECEPRHTPNPSAELKSRYFTKVELQSANEDSQTLANLEYPTSHPDSSGVDVSDRWMKFSFGDREDEGSPWLSVAELVAVSKEDPFLFVRRGYSGYRTPVDRGARWEASVRGHTQVGGRLEKIIHLRKTPFGFDDGMQPRMYAVIRMPCKRDGSLFGLDIMGRLDQAWLKECILAAWMIYAGLVKTS